MMNTEVVKAMQSKPKHKRRTWWYKNGYKVRRIVLFPIWGIILLKDRINAWLDSKQEWDKERATEILNYYIPRASEWNDENQSFYFFDNGMGWNLNLAKRYLERKDRRFWKVNCGWWGGKMRTFLIDEFELEGFTKEVGNCWDGWTEISFNLNTDRG